MNWRKGSIVRASQDIKYPGYTVPKMTLGHVVEVVNDQLAYVTWPSRVTGPDRSPKPVKWVEVEHHGYIKLKEDA